VLAEDDQTVLAVNLAPLLGPNIEVVRMGCWRWRWSACSG
jgi:hypothetical protein